MSEETLNTLAIETYMRLFSLINDDKNLEIEKKRNDPTQINCRTLTMSVLLHATSTHL